MPPGGERALFLFPNLGGDPGRRRVRGTGAVPRDGEVVDGSGVVPEVRTGGARREILRARERVVLHERGRQRHLVELDERDNLELPLETRTRRLIERVVVRAAVVRGVVPIRGPRRAFFDGPCLPERRLR